MGGKPISKAAEAKADEAVLNKAKAGVGHGPPVGGIPAIYGGVDVKVARDGKAPTRWGEGVPQKWGHQDCRPVTSRTMAGSLAWMRRRTAALMVRCCGTTKRHH